jgi:hypothetical protein
MYTHVSKCKNDKTKGESKNKQTNKQKPKKTPLLDLAPGS